MKANVLTAAEEKALIKRESDQKVLKHPKHYGKDACDAALEREEIRKRLDAKNLKAAS